MPAPTAAAVDVDEYIRGFAPDVQRILKRVRQVVRKAAPQAQEVISYRMPALKQHGMLLYYAAFQHHLGLYPPVSGDAALMKAIAPYAGEKGNLRFPYAQPIPYELIAHIAALRARQDAAQAQRPRSRQKTSG